MGFRWTDCARTDPLTVDITWSSSTSPVALLLLTLAEAVRQMANTTAWQDYGGAISASQRPPFDFFLSRPLSGLGPGPATHRMHN